MRPKTIALTFIVAGFWGCAELKDDLPPPTGTRANVHPEGWVDSASVAFHGNAIRETAWDVRQCQTCHGSDYSGGVVEVSCLTCHTNKAGPENCATCHGSANAAPPRDLSKNETTDFPGVGAHQVHLLGGDNVSSLTVACGECHSVPGSVYMAGHIDSDLPAEVVISGGLAGADPTGSFGAPAYDFQSVTCQSVFCHGAWSLDKASSPYPDSYAGDVMEGNNYAPTWTGGEDQATCGTCHGLPPTGHVAAEPTECGNAGCHPGVVDPDGVIDDVQLHINGRVNVNDADRPF
jgi:predicted CxxxxCH...CXXCH cytochrome family protein